MPSLLRHCRVANRNGLVSSSKIYGSCCIGSSMSECGTIYEPSHGMTEEELHNFCKFLYSQVQSKDEEISRLTANIKQLTDEVRLSRLQQQAHNDENMALGATHSQKLDVVLQQLQKLNGSLPIRREGWKQLRPCWLMPMRKIISWKLNERSMPRSVRIWRMR